MRAVTYFVFPDIDEDSRDQLEVAKYPTTIKFGVTGKNYAQYLDLSLSQAKCLRDKLTELLEDNA